jgi:anti-anti-sigma factor
VRSFVPTVPRSGEFAVVADWLDEVTVLVRMQGALDFYSVRDAKRLLLKQLKLRPRRLVIDVSDTFVDSSGIGLLVHVAQRVSMERGNVRIVCDRRLGELLRVHRLDKLIPIAETVDEALERTAFRAPRTPDPAYTGDGVGEALRRVA